eukprot:TRINITY_DN75100_c0_g1_i1.p1 TRINITY_DN75100_c0_g1~~TRINITY_DN75100_c0_g1_i1.p1  ORF type:complete len:510 (+),score=61.03 TRINITY_DN75100_c0_g1_i1:49-1578(+)
MRYYRYLLLCTLIVGIIALGGIATKMEQLVTPTASVVRGWTTQGKNPSSCPRIPFDNHVFSTYCNVGPVTGGEGALSMPDCDSEGSNDCLELRAVVLNIRHGDRSGIHSLGANPTARLSSHITPSPREQQFDCALGDLEPRWKNIQRQFRVVSASSGELLHGRLQPKLSGNGTVCAPGQLTAQGIRQHFQLGAHLRKAYSKLLGQSFRFYSRSTDFRRTISSAAALLSEMLQGTPREVAARASASNAVEIATHENMSKEIMLGKDVKFNERIANGGEIGDDQGSCQAVVRGIRSQRDAWKNPHREYDTLSAMFGPSIANQSVSDIADVLYAASCHGMPLPSGHGGCMAVDLATSVCRHAHTFFCMRYAGLNGGGQANQLLMYPFLREVLNHLQKAATSGADPSFTLFSGHDTVIAPVLAALGVYSGNKCGWPPYASRIAFELFRVQRKSLPSAPSGDEHFVRVMYNGKPMQGVHGCGADVELCPLANFSAGVESLLGSFADYAHACKDG